MQRIVALIVFLTNASAFSPIIPVRLQQETDTAKYRIAILDSGYDPDLAVTPLKLCKTGHFDFSKGTDTIGHTHPHGSWISNIIAERLKDVDYCAVIYEVGDAHGNATMENCIGALKLAKNAGLVAINISLTGVEHKYEEEFAIKQLSARGTAIFVAAGNDHLDLTQNCTAYPACYSTRNLYVVGAYDPEDPRIPSRYSNYGQRVVLWYDGTYKDDQNEARGTSFASPRALSDYVYSLDHLGQ